LSSPIGKLAFSAPQSHTELSLRSKLLSGQMLSGIIDRLFKDEEGVWNILDFKTDLRENNEKKNRYEFQLQFYAYLVSLLYNADVVKAHILFTHSGNSLSFIFTQKEFDKIRKRLESLVSEIRIQKKTRSVDDIERRLSHCPDCPYFDWKSDLCVAGAGNNPIPLQTKLLFGN
ncbi:MAG: PD-(D/E)XK nuclease family protein, partial [Candidatus Kapaibacterium sp.]